MVWTLRKEHKRPRPIAVRPDCTACGPFQGEKKDVFQSILCQKLGTGDLEGIVILSFPSEHLTSISSNQRLPSLNETQVGYVKIDLSAALGFLVESVVLKP